MLKVLKVFLICFVIVLCVKGSSLLAQSRNFLMKMLEENLSLLFVVKT